MENFETKLDRRSVKLKRMEPCVIGMEPYWLVQNLTSVTPESGLQPSSFFLLLGVGDRLTGLTNMRKYYREHEQIDISLLPTSLMPDLEIGPSNAREKAVLEVLRQIPDVDYWKLAKRFKEFSWFIPTANDCIQFASFDGNTDISMEFNGQASSGKLAMIIYLSPELETAPTDLLLCAVADKLAHILLGHEVMVNPGKEAEAKDREERQRKLQDWGFGDEANKFGKELAVWGTIQ